MRNGCQIASARVSDVETYRGLHVLHRDYETAADVVAPWNGSLPNERKAINCICLEALLAALPLDWMSEIGKWLAARRQSFAPEAHVDPTYAIPADLRIPPCLFRDPGDPTENMALGDAPTLVSASSAYGNARRRGRRETTP
jgi:hypothetical protein